MTAVFLERQAQRSRQRQDWPVSEESPRSGIRALLANGNITSLTPAGQSDQQNSGVPGALPQENPLGYAEK